VLHDRPDDPASAGFGPMQQPNRPWPDFADEGVQTVLEGVMVSGEHPTRPRVNGTLLRLAAQTAMLDTGWRSQYTFDEALEDYLKWLSEHPY
jgi:nucleoside-diphosphate-sugar epimerase